MNTKSLEVILNQLEEVSLEMDNLKGVLDNLSLHNAISLDGLNEINAKSFDSAAFVIKTLRKEIDNVTDTMRHEYSSRFDQDTLLEIK